MNKLNIAEWKEYSIDELFIIKRPVSRTIKQYDTGSIPFVSSGNFNNGIDKFVTPMDNEILDKGNCITISPVDGSCFYQAVDFLGRGGGGSSIILLYNENINEKNGLFISAVIGKTLSRFYQYNDMGSSASIKKEKIKLPVKNDIPDWDYMNNFIENIYKKEIDNQYHITGYIEKSQTREIDLKQWRAFCIGDLFEIKKADVIHSRGVTEYGSDDLDKLHKISVPYIVRTKFNNGIKCRVIKTDTMQPAPSGVISFGAENTTFFYQQEEFVSGRDIYYLDTRNYSKKICLFLISCLQPIAQKYSYNYGLFPDLLKKEMIKLPIDIDGNPDWEYMEQFIDNLYDKEREKIKVILSIH
ncbi:restriction endonuclease subunit S [Lonepinella sp. MS14437]|uniref:restriction endonuclease subunit S n=1 Tax=unclassified Lonepinella TaxID=2642006 RepID=UPI0036DED59E